MPDLEVRISISTGEKAQQIPPFTLPEGESLISMLQTEPFPFTINNRPPIEGGPRISVDLQHTSYAHPIGGSAEFFMQEATGSIRVSFLSI